MTAKSKNPKYSQNRTDAMIGAGVRVEGNLAFTGVLRIQGEVLGNVSCDVDSNGTVVVGKTGNVTGTIKAPHIVVSGTVQGPVYSSESIEIQQEARVAGDAFYKAIDIHAGGVIEGLLAPVVLTDGDRPEHDATGRNPEPPPAKECGLPSAGTASTGSRAGAYFGGGRRLGGIVVLLIAVVVVVVVLANRVPAPAAPPLADVAPPADPAAKENAAAQSTPDRRGDPRGAAAALPGDVVPLAPGADAEANSVAPAPPPDLAEMDQEKVVTVQGVNPGKPAGFFSVVSKEPAVLFKKKRQDPAEGTRIEVSQGAAESIAIARNEIFRVAEGRDLTIFYQGRKVPPKTIQSGAWMSFVPQSSSGAGDRK